LLVRFFRFFFGAGRGGGGGGPVGVFVPPPPPTPSPSEAAEASAAGNAGLSGFVFLFAFVFLDSCFAHGLAAQLDAMGVVHEPVEDAVGDGMPRRSRCVLSDVPYHITQGGVDECVTFPTEDGCHTYLRLFATIGVILRCYQMHRVGHYVPATVKSLRSGCPPRVRQKNLILPEVHTKQLCDGPDIGEFAGSGLRPSRCRRRD